MEDMLADMELKQFHAKNEEMFGLNTRSTEGQLPETEEELQVHMQLKYKQPIELAEEQAINLLFEGNKYDLTQKRFYYDLTVLGIGAVKTEFNTSEGVVIKYVILKTCIMLVKLKWYQLTS